MITAFNLRLVVWACRMTLIVRNVNFRIYFCVADSLENPSVRFGITGLSVYGAPMLNTNLHQTGHLALGSMKLIQTMSKQIQTVMVLTSIWTMSKGPPFQLNWHGNLNLPHLVVYLVNINSAHCIPQQKLKMWGHQEKSTMANIVFG